MDASATNLPAWAKVSAGQIEAAKRLGVPPAFENSVGVKMVLIPAGSFVMGSGESDDMRNDSETQHTVRITRPFYMSIHEVTQRQYEAVAGEDPSYRKGGEMPVEQVSIIDAERKFLSKLSAGEGRTYRLPTEAQWEYACRAGSTTRYCFGDDPAGLDEYAWYTDNSDGSSHPVGLKKPNAWGLYDMHGNVWEWCSCFLVPYGSAERTDPVGRRENARHRSEKVIRGGAFAYGPKQLRSCQRYRDGVTHRHDIIGFRPVMEIDEKGD